MLVATSNDAPDAFPILTPKDLGTGSRRVSSSPKARRPDGPRPGSGSAISGRPKWRRVGEEYWLTYTARDRERVLSIGLAKAPQPTGPVDATSARPLLTGAMIDAHLFVDEDGPVLFWKKDSNSLWPRPLAACCASGPS